MENGFSTHTEDSWILLGKFGDGGWFNDRACIQKYGKQYMVNFRDEQPAPCGLYLNNNFILAAVKKKESMAHGDTRSIYDHHYTDNARWNACSPVYTKGQCAAYYCRYCTSRSFFRHYFDCGKNTTELQEIYLSSRDSQSVN